MAPKSPTVTVRVWLPDGTYVEEVIRGPLSTRKGKGTGR